MSHQVVTHLTLDAPNKNNPLLWAAITTNQPPGLGSILDTVSKDTEDTAHSCILSVSKIHFQTTFINGICI